MEKSKTMEMKNWERWPGNNSFFLKGHLITGPYPRGLAITFIVINVPGSLACAYPYTVSPS